MKHGQVINDAHFNVETVSGETVETLLMGQQL